MAKGSKTSSEKIAEVISCKVGNPDLSYRDISELTWVNYVTVGDILKKEMPEVLTSSNKKRELVDINLETIRIASEKVMQAMGTMSPENIRDAKTMQEIVDTAFKQNRLIEEKATEIVWVNDLRNVSTEELLKRREWNKS